MGATEWRWLWQERHREAASMDRPPHLPTRILASVISGQAHPTRVGADQRGKVHEVQQSGLQELPNSQRALHADESDTRKDDLAVLDCADFDSRAVKSGEVLKKSRVHLRQGRKVVSKVCDVLSCEFEVLEVAEDLQFPPGL